MTIHESVASVLIDIEAELRSLDQWDAEAPPPSALASSEPFCVDTLRFSQWLQFVFVPRMSGLVEVRAPLPSACDIAPMAEEYYRGAQLPVAGLLAALREIDRLLSQQ